MAAAALSVHLSLIYVSNWVSLGFFDPYSALGWGLEDVVSTKQWRWTESNVDSDILSVARLFLYGAKWILR